MSSTSDPAVFARELRHLAQRHIARSFKFGSKPEIEIEEICGLAEAWFPDVWPQDQVSAIAEVIRSGASRLRGDFGRVTRSRAALVLFDLEGEDWRARWKLADLNGRYSEVRVQVRNESGLIDSTSNFGRKLKGLRLGMAHALIDINSAFKAGKVEIAKADAGEPANPVRSIFGACGTSYVRRPEYHDDFRAALSSGRKIVVFEGPPGMGKERLATEVFSEHVIENSARFDVFRGGEPEEFACELAVRLGEYGVMTDGMTNEQLFRAFAAHLGSDRARACTLILDLREVRILSWVSPAPKTSALVVVSSCPVPKLEGIARLRVGSMGLESACRVASQFLPGASDGEVARLVETVGGSPQALDKAAHFISQSRHKVSVEDFCRSFPRNAALILRSTSSDLLEGYGRTLETLRRDHPDAAEMLDGLAFLADIVPVDLLVEVLAEKNGGHGDDAAVFRGAALCAIDILKGYALVSQHDMTVRTHALARAVSRDLLRSDRGAEVAERLRGVILAEIQRRAGSTCQSQSISELMGSVRSLINQLYHVEHRAAATGDEKEAGRHVAKAIRGVWGNFLEGSLMSVVPVLEGGVSVHRWTLRLDDSSQLSKINIRRFRSASESESAG